MKRIGYLLLASMLLISGLFVTACGGGSNPKTVTTSDPCSELKDSDSDGVSNAEECEAGTDAYMANSTTEPTSEEEDSTSETDVEATCTVDRDGDAVTITCPDGSSETIIDGEDGASGNDGGDGISCTIDNDTITCDDGTQLSITSDGCDVVIDNDTITFTCGDSIAVVDLRLFTQTSTEVTEASADWQAHYLNAVRSVGVVNIYDSNGNYYTHASAWVGGQNKVITNWHVAEFLEINYSICVEFPDNQTLSGEIIYAGESCVTAYDDSLKEFDLAVLTLNTGDHEPLPLCATEYGDVEVLSDVMAMGYPLYRHLTVSQDIISAKYVAGDTDITSMDPTSMLIKHEAKIDGGSSGGPLLMEEDGNACVVAVNFGGILQTDTHYYAVSTDYLRDYDWATELPPVGCSTTERRLVDSDGDTYGDPDNYVQVNVCDPWEDGYVSWTEGRDDCDDNDPAINPGATEVDDGVDNNCDGEVDEGFNDPTPLVENPDWDLDFDLVVEAAIPTTPVLNTSTDETLGTIVEISSLPGLFNSDHWKVQYRSLANVEWVDGNTYRVQGKVRASSAGSVKVEVEGVNDSNASVFESVDVFSNEVNEWKDFSIEFTSAQSAMSMIRFHLGLMDGTVEFADIRYGQIN